MQADLKGLGFSGEEAAAGYLREKGFKVLKQNYRCRMGEVDLIVEKEETISFVEVKTRRSLDTVSPLELIPYGKQRHISRVAQHFLAAQNWHGRNANFAMVIVDWSAKKPVCELLEHIFELTWGY